MKNFEYGHPRTEAAAVELLAEPDLSTAVLAGGTDLIGLMKRSVVAPDRVVNISDIESLRHIELDGVDLTGQPMHLRAQHGLGYLPQEASIFRKLTVAENIWLGNLPGSAARIDWRRMRASAAKVRRLTEAASSPA